VWSAASAWRSAGGPTPAVANLVWVLLLVAGGVVVPRTELPSAISGVVAALPSAALADGLRAAFGSGTLLVGPAFVLVVWAVVATALTTWTFRWSG